MEGKIQGKRKIERPRRNYIELGVEYQEYQEIKKKTEDRCTWPLLHGEEHGSLFEEEDIIINNYGYL